MDEAAVQIPGQNYADLLDRAEHFASDIEGAISAFKPPCHAGCDAEISFVDGPRKQASLDRHPQGRSDKGESIEDRVNLNVSPGAHCGYCGQFKPLVPVVAHRTNNSAFAEVNEVF